VLEHTFVHIPGIGSKTEQGIWSRGLFTWEDFLRYDREVFSRERDRFIRSELESSQVHREDLDYFWQRLPPAEKWRVFPAFQRQAVYLDIETTGCFQGGDEITLIGIYDGQQVRTFINGSTLDEFETALTPDALLVTYNGTGFDLPFIRRWFRHLHLPPAHIDLRYLFQRLGYRGGLKAIERQVGISRAPDLDGLDGFDAVMLWKAYQWGDQPSLERLIRYNTLDVINLEPLMEICFRKLKNALGAFL
jgi:uncharacterized protein YprB with RNaseH-like and TPR domain